MPPQHQLELLQAKKQHELEMKNSKLQVELDQAAAHKKTRRRAGSYCPECAVEKELMEQNRQSKEANEKFAPEEKQSVGSLRQPGGTGSPRRSRTSNQDSKGHAAALRHHAIYIYIYIIHNIYIYIVYNIV